MLRFLLHGAMRRLSRLAEAGIALAGGLVCSQLSTFLQQYTQNLAGRLDEALQAKIDRAAELADAHHALVRAGLLEKPFALLTHLDPATAADTWRHFQPAVPLDTAGLIYAGMGAVLALFAWELAALTVRLVRRRVRGAAARPDVARVPKGGARAS